jgi:hypothetical protein
MWRPWSASAVDPVAAVGGGGRQGGAVLASSLAPEEASEEVVEGVAEERAEHSAGAQRDHREEPVAPIKTRVAPDKVVNLRSWMTAPSTGGRWGERGPDLSDLGGTSGLAEAELGERLGPQAFDRRRGLAGWARPDPVGYAVEPSIRRGVRERLDHVERPAACAEDGPRRAAEEERSDLS